MRISLSLLIGVSAALLPLAPVSLHAAGPSMPVPTVNAHRSLAAADAWAAVSLMSPGINIGNTFDSTAGWETGWGSPIITKEFIQGLARAGFKSVRVPVAWDTYSDKGRITEKQFKRIDEIVDWILEAGMFCVLNIHWDGGWIDSSDKEKFPDTLHTFSKDAEKKFRSYWDQIARHYAHKDERLLFEGLNEQTNFENEGSLEKSYATLTRVNQLFLDTVRKTGGKNARRFLIVTGYSTDFTKTSDKLYKLPKDSVPGKLFVSVHYYTPWLFVGVNEDPSWGKMQPTWGSEEDVKQLNDLFDGMAEFCKRTNTPAYVGEFSMCSRKEKVYSNLWTASVFNAAVKRKMIPVLWDTGSAVSRKPPYEQSADLADVKKLLRTMSRPATGQSSK
jgi:endoglucanase